MRLLLIILALTIGVAVNPSTASAQSAGPMVVTKPWARASILQSRPGVAYLTTRNNSASADQLLGVTSPIANNVRIHTSSMSNGVMTMRSLPYLRIEVGQEIKMQPGGMHLMLTGLRKPLREGAQLPLVLEFKTAGRLQVNAQILSIIAKGPKGE